MEPATKSALLGQLGVSEPTAKYYAIASSDSAARTALILDKLPGVQNQQQMNQLLFDGMIPVNGKKIVTSDVITNLVNQGIISKDYAKFLNSFVFNPQTGRLEQKPGTGGSSSSVKKPSYTMPKLSMPSKPKMSGGTRTIKVSIPKLKAPVLAPPKF
jgi:hypothetical protein